MHNHQPTLPVDVNYNSKDIEGNESENRFVKETFDVVLIIKISIIANIH